jgi:hypothetical protein
MPASPSWKPVVEPPVAAAGRTTIGRTAAEAGFLAAAVAWSAVIVAHYMPMCVPWWSRGTAGTYDA